MDLSHSIETYFLFVAAALFGCGSARSRDHSQRANMAAINGAEAPRPGEESPLLRDEQTSRNAGVNGVDGRISGITSSPREADKGKANQQVGKTRAVLIILSLWGLIFLQGKFSESSFDTA